MSDFDLDALTAARRENEFAYLKTAPRTVYELSRAECAALAENGPDKFWVIIERTTTAFPVGDPMPDQAFGPYPSEDAAAKAMNDSLLIRDACEQPDDDATVDECYYAPMHAEDAEVILVDLTDPDHTGDEKPDTPSAGPIGIFRRGVYATPPHPSTTD